jgi:Homeodomain-like domain
MPVIVIQPLMQFVFASPLIILWAPLNQLSRKTRRNAVIDQIDCVFRHDAIAVFAHPRPNPALQFVDILVKLVREFLADSMNKLTKQARAQILHLLCEGQSIRAVTQLTGCSKNTVAKLLVGAGHACAAFQDKALRNLPCKRVQMDEIWSFVYAKNSNVKGAKAAPATAGDVRTWTAICADTKLIVSWLLGARDLDAAVTFTRDLESRLANRVQLTSDGHAPYLLAVPGAFADQVDYAMLIKQYGADPQAEKRYSPAKCIGAKKKPIESNPDPQHISTSYVERSNLTMRMFVSTGWFLQVATYRAGQD